MVDSTHFFEKFQPTHYDIYLDIDRSAKHFAGVTTIKGNASAAEIALHQKFLNVTSVQADGQAVPFSFSDRQEAINIKLPHPTASMEQRGLLEGRFVLPDGDTVVVACTHLEAFDAVSRQAQAEFVEEHYAHTTHPVVLAGDFNAPPGDAFIQRLASVWRDCTGNTPTFSVKQPREKIDYIFACPMQSWQVVDWQVIPVAMSDHFPVVATLVKQ